MMRLARPALRRPFRRALSAAAAADDVTVSRFPGAMGAPFTHTLSVARSEHKTPVYRVLDLEGRVEAPGYDESRHGEALLTRCYETMVLLHSLDTVFNDAQRQGRLSFYMQSRGEEAATVCSAAALDDADVIASQYRETGAYLWRGYTLPMVADQCFSNARDLGKGRQMPMHFGSRDLHLQTISSPLTTQLPQAVGTAYALKQAGVPNVAACYFGEGAASEGDFHAALNFASTLDCPVVFIVRNNGYAISTPVDEQFRGDGIASRAPGYGMHFARVDGNDALAVLDAVGEARRVALGESRPVLLELMSYRGGHHSTSDDSTRYRESDEIKYWNEKNNALSRLRLYLERRGWWDADRETALRTQSRRDVLKEMARAEAEKKPSTDELFSDVYSDKPAHLRRQERELREHLEEFGERYGLEVYKQ